MRLFGLFWAVGVFALLLQTTLLHLLPLGRVVPDLTLVLCVYLGLNHPTLGSVLGVLSLGYSVDIFSSPVTGIHAFALSLVFVVVYVSSQWIWVRNPLLSSAVVFFASWVKGAVLLLLSFFVLSQNSLEPAGVLQYTLLDSVVAALLAPPLFFGLNRARARLERSRIAL